MSNSDSTKKEVIAVSADDGRVVVPLLNEELSVRKEKRATGRVRVATVTREREELIDELLAREQVEVEKVAVGKPINAIPPVREEGDTIFIPIVEEVLAVERRLVLKEEVRIRRVRSTERHQERVTLRKQEAMISRLPADTAIGETNSIAKDRSEDHTQEKK
jgi:uncharacterized protein (TIGR02271 family)